MTRERVVDILKTEIECVNRADECGRDCANCELVLPDIEIFEAYNNAIKDVKRVDDIIRKAKELNLILSEDYMYGE